MGVRALGAFSGGLDSMIAALLLRDQGIEVHLATFYSPFFSSDEGEKRARQLGMPWRRIDFSGQMMQLIEDPPSGFGKRLNPCIDCHAGMFRVLCGIAEKERFDFLFSGEVIGQRPMSQQRNTMNRVKKLSESGDILLRPLSAKLLSPTKPEREGIVDREKLLDISGRGRKRQIALADKYGIEYRNPGGGCLLTDPNYCNRLRELMDVEGLVTSKNASLIRHGRFFRLAEDTFCLIGRDKEDNEALEALAGGALTYSLDDIPGPTGVLVGDDSLLPEMKALVRKYAGMDT
ncbi:MAG: hypothetical protein GF388_05920 [Candidatus Aegiribacteria sp.]|nr:hypothetical protein [Candidatus Aegiribacteria sp.]MBD3294718.1 hypothetical protein [Candidatus Fermentibacteria bacterium]